ncbi:MAG: acyl-CoA thioesterase [Sandaracinus sp.]
MSAAGPIETPVHLPRHAFSARDVARAGDVWRAFQEVAVEASTAAGWPPSRYRDENVAFIVRSMTVRHAREAVYGERLTGTTWVSRMRREMFSTREVRIQGARGPIASARQEWVHVAASGASLEPARGSAALLEAFPPIAGPAGDVSPELPAIAERCEPKAPHVFELEAFYTWMDPLDHANHPAYVDWADEALSRALASAGIAPLLLVPVAEEATFRSGVTAAERVRVETTLRGRTAEGFVVCDHRILATDRLCASVTTVRRLLDRPERDLEVALGG